MKIAYNPTGGSALSKSQIDSLKNDIIFDLSGMAVYARGIPVGKVYLPFEKSTSSTTEGYNGLVPFPDYNGNSETRFLREDGTWVVPTDTTYSIVNSTTDGLAPKIGTSASATITTQADEWVLTSTKGATPTWRKLPGNAFSNTNNYRPISVNGTSILGNNNTALNLVAGTNITLSPKKDSNNKYTGEVTITASNPAWDNITGKPTTLSGYGITDAFKWYGAITSSNDDSLWGKLGAQSYGGVLPDGLTGQYYYGILTSFNNNKGTSSQFQLYASDYREEYQEIKKRHIAWRTGFGANKGEWHRLANIDTENIFTKSPTFEKQIKSTIETGTAPLSVVSTTLVTNLNAEMVGGLRAANFTRAIRLNQGEVIPRNIYSVGYIVGTGVDGETPKGEGGGYLASVRDDGYGGHLFISNSGSVFSRGVKNSAVSSWQELAFTDSNVASAQKLAHSNGEVGAIVAEDGRLEKVASLYNIYGVGVKIAHGAAPTSVGDLSPAVVFGRQDTIQSSYGTAIWGTGDGKGHIQVGRLDKTATAYSLCLQEFGGNVGIGTTSPDEKLEVSGNIKATSFLGNLDGSYINKLTGYTKATAVSAITANDTLNAALGKLELKAGIAYDLVKGAYNGDGTIENLAEILKVLEGISDTDTIKSLLGKYRRLDKDEFYGSEVQSKFWINRTIEGGGGWSYVPILVFKADKKTKLLNIGVYGNNSDLIYSYIGSNDHNSTKNLRIYPDGTVTAPVFNGNLNYTNLTGSTTTANQAIVSNGTKDGWTLKTLGSNAFNSNTYLQILGNVNANELKENGVGYITLNGPNDNGPIISFGGTNYHTQIHSDYLGNNLYWRVNKNNELQGWKQIVSIDILSDYLSNKSWNKVVPYVYESPTVYYYCYKIAQLNLSATLSGIAVIELLGIGDSNYANMASAKLKISRYYSASEKTTDGKTTHTISRKYTIGLLSDSYKGCYFVAYLDSDGGVWVKCHKCEWTSSLQWRLVSNGSSNTGLITNIYDSTTAEYIKTVPDNVKATAYPNQFAEWSKRTVKTKSEGETEWAETTDSEGITDGGFNTPFGSNLTTWYNDTVYDILTNNNNGNIVLNSCGGALYLGYKTTSSISLEKPTYAKYNITALGDIILKNSSGTAATPYLKFQRGSTNDSYVDWRFGNNNNGKLILQYNYNDTNATTETWNDVFVTTRTISTFNSELKVAGRLLTLGNSNGSNLLFKRPDANYIWADEPGGYFVIGVKDAGSISTDKASLIISGNLVYPGKRNNAVSLGTSSYKWSNIYSVLGNFSGNVTASKFITSGGTASQFVKGDGSLDSNTYVSKTEFPNLSSKGLYKNLTSSGGGSNINKWKKFARINLSSDKVYTQCGGYMFIYDHEGHRVKGILDFHVRTIPDTSIDNSNINLQSPYLKWHILDDSNYASNIKMVKVENGIFDLYITTSQSYTTFVILVFTPRSDKITLFDETWIDTLPENVICTSSYTITVPNATTATKLANTLTFSAGNFTSKTYNGSSAVTVNIPTHTSHLTNDSFAVHNDVVKNVPSLTRSTLGYAYGCGDTCEPYLDSFWYTSGPVALFGTSKYLCAIQADAGNNNVIKYKKVVNGSAQESWKTFVNSDGTQIGSSVRPVYVKNDGSVAPFTLSNATANDTRNILVGYDNGIYLVTSAKINPSTGILTANGFVKSGSTDSHVLLGAGGHKALSDFLLETEFASKELASNLTTITKTLVVSKDWVDTGIVFDTATFPNGTGSYIVQLSKDDLYYWTGCLSIVISNNVTASDSDEILLHGGGFDTGIQYYLRTVHDTTNKVVKLQIARNNTYSTSKTYTFKFKKLI